MGTWGTNWGIFHSILVGAWWEQIEKISGTIWNTLGTSESLRTKPKKKPFGVGRGGEGG